MPRSILRFRTGRRRAEGVSVGIDKAGMVRYKKVLDKPGDLVPNDELLAELDKLK